MHFLILQNVFPSFQKKPEIIETSISRSMKHFIPSNGKEFVLFFITEKTKSFSKLPYKANYE